MKKYYTKGNPFDNVVFDRWFKKAMKDTGCYTILEPFAGNEDLIKRLKEINGKNYNIYHQSYDIKSQKSSIIKQDTLKKYPKGYDIVITNPPWLAKNVASEKQKKMFKSYDDLYKVALSNMLNYNRYIFTLLPASFINADSYWHHRLKAYILFEKEMFDDTEHPFCLAIFGPTCNKIPNDFKIYEIDKNNRSKFITTKHTFLQKFEKHFPKNKEMKLNFNDPKGTYGAITIDSSVPNIKFVEGYEIDSNKIKVSSRNFTRFSVPHHCELWNVWYLNHRLKQFYEIGGHYFLTPFKGRRKDGKYRRRLDFETIKRLYGGNQDND